MKKWKIIYSPFKYLELYDEDVEIVEFETEKEVRKYIVGKYKWNYANYEFEEVIE